MEMNHLEKSHNADQWVTAVQLGLFSITQMANQMYWDLNDRRRLGSDDEEQNLDDHCVVFVIGFMCMERGSDIINVAPMREEPVENMIRQLHGL